MKPDTPIKELDALRKEEDALDQSVALNRIVMTMLESKRREDFWLRVILIISIRVNKSGLYHLSADVTYTPTAAGVVILQLYKDGVALPCAIAQQTVAAGDVYTSHIETDLCLTTCCVNHPLITLDISGVAGTVNHTCVGMVKLA